ncbi:phage minor head protein [Geobacter anodireducens]|uniref:Phage head morphogenesis domain-containing protein n=1 Tax=Geobacter anodireducens TaxID=1340425 RepID=A0ABR9NXG7_9BACT|nr:phage minor head protein [Geobacter anodireducens]MBE2888956.1 hypothetical protein [Geobacter anodireducens]
MTGAEFEKTFKLGFTEASAFFRGKLNIPTDQWDDLWKDQHAKGFMVAGANKAELLTDFRNAVQKSVDGDMTLREFQERFDEVVKTHGWSYNGSRNWRSALIYNTNVRTAYMAGRWRQLTEPDTLMPYLVYRHADGVLHPRPLHVAWDGLTLPKASPFWRTHYPPNGWGCHCKVFAASQAEYEAARAIGKGTAPAEVVDLRTGAPLGIDYGWDYNVGMAADRSYQILGEKFERLPSDIARAWMKEHVSGPAFERFIEGKIGGEFPVAVLNPADMEALGTKAQSVWFSQQTLLEHLDRHPEIGLEDYRLIPEILDQGEVYQRDDVRLIYLYRGERLYRAGLKKTADDRENYFLTLFETSDEKAKREVVGKYERIR